jgi:hypothetical protein
MMEAKIMTKINEPTILPIIMGVFEKLFYDSVVCC